MRRLLIMLNDLTGSLMRRGVAVSITLLREARSILCDELSIKDSKQRRPKNKILF